MRLVKITTDKRREEEDGNKERDGIIVPSFLSLAVPRYQQTVWEDLAEAACV